MVERERERERERGFGYRRERGWLTERKGVVGEGSITLLMSIRQKKNVIICISHV